jgi:2-amino-4-hydroxy-6-hydroxymethyldihydropteridine diphosphokinase
VDVLLGLGGNLGNPPAAFRKAVDGLARNFEVRSTSSLFRSLPVGPPQPRFWNMAVVVRCGVPPLVVLDVCQRLEQDAGRVRDHEDSWGPRTLDIDLLLIPGIVHRSQRLAVPHPLLHQRAFALVPAAELVPLWRHQVVGQTIAELAAAVAGQDVEREGPM